MRVSCSHSPFYHSSGESDIDESTGFRSFYSNRSMDSNGHAIKSSPEECHSPSSKSNPIILRATISYGSFYHSSVESYIDKVIGSRSLYSNYLMDSDR